MEDCAKLRPSHGDIHLEIVFDETRDRYALMQVGWDQGKRVRGNLLYITLHGDQVHLEYDGLGHGIAERLIAAGIPEDHLVFAYLPERQDLVAA